MPPNHARASTSDNSENRTCGTESAAGRNSSTADTVSTKQTTFNVTQASIEQLL